MQKVASSHTFKYYSAMTTRLGNVPRRNLFLPFFCDLKVSGQADAEDKNMIERSAKQREIIELCTRH